MKLKDFKRYTDKRLQKCLFEYNTYSEENFAKIQDEIKNVWYLLNSLQERTI